MLTKPLEEVFHIRRPRSATLGDYEDGPIPYLGNSFGSNPIAKYVTPFEDDRIFRGLYRRLHTASAPTPH